MPLLRCSSIAPLFCSRADRHLNLGRAARAHNKTVVMMAMAVSAAQAASFVLKWSPQAQSDGLQAFESIEDDREHSDPGLKHIYVQGNDYRFDMPLKQRESGSAKNDRQRNEVVGMEAKQTGKSINILQGETWRLRHRIFIPKSLQATTSFTHIMQLKQPGKGTLPILTLSLRLKDNIPTIELNLFTRGKILASTPLSPLQNKWIQSEITFTASDNGAIQWILTDYATKAVVEQADGFGDLFLADRVRPKWGIYRSVSDKAHLQDCFMLITDMKAWKRE